MFRTSNDTTNSHYISLCVWVRWEVVFSAFDIVEFSLSMGFFNDRKTFTVQIWKPGVPRICTDKYTIKSYNGSQNGLGASMGWLDDRGPFCPQCNCCVHSCSAKVAGWGTTTTTQHYEIRSNAFMISIRFTLSLGSLNLKKITVCVVVGVWERDILHTERARENVFWQ